MALPPYYPNLFTNAVDWTFEENSEFPTPVSSSYLTSANGYPAFIWPNNTITAPGLAGINSFVPEVGRPYLLHVTMRKTSAVTNGVTSWIRPGFYAFKDTSYTTASFDVIGPTAGLGLTDINGFIDTSSWNVNEWHDVFCSWTPDIAYVMARPRIRINRNEADLAPYSDASYEIKSFEVLPEISIEEIHAEFGGPIPAELSNYYRKSILPAITANFADWPETLYSFLESESGIHTTNFANGVSRYTTDGGDFGPRGDLTFGINNGSLSLVTDPVEGTVLQGQGVNWGGVNQPRGFGKVSYSKVEAGITYTVTVRKKLVTNPTNTEFSPKMYTQLWCYEANGHYIGAYNIPNASPLVLTVAGGWTNIVGTYTLAEITSYPWLANTVYVRPYTYDNVYDYTNNVGAYNYIVCNCVVQTASFTTTTSSGSLKGIGLNKIYNVTNGVDAVYVLNGTTWSIDSQQSITDLGTPRQATNPYTKRIIRIGDFLVIDSPTTSRIPTSGTINFSDFLGSSQTSGPIFYTPDFLGNVDGNKPVSFGITAYSLSNSAITFSYDYLPGGLTNVAVTANTVTVGGKTYIANTITFSGTSGYTLTPTYPVGWNLQASDPYITVEKSFYYNNLNLTPTWVTASGSLGSFANGSTVSIQLSASDPEGIQIEYTVANGGALPNNLTLSYTGLLSGTLTAPVGTYPFNIRASDGPFYTDQSFSIIVEETPVPPVWQTASGQLTAAGTGESYSTQLVANTAVSYSIVSGSLPTGMSLDTITGIITGTPTGTSQSQTSTTFRSFPYMTSDTSPDGYTAYALSTIYGTSTLTSNNALQTPNTAYYAFDGIDNLVAFTFAYQTYGFSFPLVLGMTAPHKVNVGSYDVKSYSFGSDNSSTPKAWQLQGSNDGINWVTVDTRSNITSWTIGYTLLSFTLPTVVSYYQYRMYITEQGVMPSPSGVSPVTIMEITFKDYASVFTVRATGSNGLYSDREFGISVHTGATAVSWNSPPEGDLGVSAVGAAYSFIANTSTINEVGSTVYSVSGGTLPAGTNLNASTGAITGTLTNATTLYSFTIRATNNGAFSERSFTGSVISPPEWQNAAGQLVGAQSGQSYTTQLVANTATTYSIISGSLPTGLSLNTSTGIISGTPTGTSQSQTSTTFKSFPYMTSDTTPTGYTAYALATIPGTSTLTNNNVLQSNNYAYQLFDGSMSSMPAFYIADNGSPTAITMPFILGMVSPYKVNVGAYDITCLSTNNSGIINGNTIKNWTLQGSNDGVNWTTVDTRSNITSWSPYGYATMSFTLPTAVSYYQFRLYVTALGQPSNYAMLVSELVFYDYASVFTVRATSANGLSSDRQFGISVH